MKELKRETGLDIFRILCCLGVLLYHVFEDILFCGSVPKAIYFGASFCVPGFFLLSGYLIANKKEISLEYCSNKIIKTLKILFYWIVFWCIVHFIRTNELYNIVEMFLKGILSDGVLPVSWFLFTYCFIMIFANFLYKLLNNHFKIFTFISVLLIILLSFEVGRDIFYYKTQALWLDIYFSYFIIGMWINKVLKLVNSKSKIIIRIFSLILLVSSIAIYSLKVMDSINVLPYYFYGKWYYTLLLITLFILIVNINIQNSKLISKIAKNTLSVYLGHLPILIYITNIRPLKSTLEAIIMVIFLFIITQLMAEIMKKMPILKDMV